VSKNPDKELEEFLASKPAWMRRYFQNGIGYLNQDELVEMLQNGEIITLTSEYEKILQQMPVKWRDYRRRLKRENKIFDLLIPKGKAGRPVDNKAGEYFEQHSSDSSYADIAKQELQSEPEGEAKSLLIPKERERIRASVRRTRRRQSAKLPRT
jgi:hypothetical protein